MTEKSKAAECFTCYPDAERLQSNIEDAIDEWVGNLPDPDGDLPETVVVYEFARMKLPESERQAEWMLELLLERLDEDFADPDSSKGTVPTEKMKAAALAFVRAVYGEYVVWTCEQVGKREVKVADYGFGTAFIQRHAKGGGE